MTLLPEEKEEFLNLLNELINYLSTFEAKEFENIAQICERDITFDEIREARLRDIQRLKQIDDKPSTAEIYKASILLKIQNICPQIVPIIEKIEYSIWNLNKKDHAIPQDIMLSIDWEEFLDFCEVLIS